MTDEHDGGCRWQSAEEFSQSFGLLAFPVGLDEERIQHWQMLYRSKPQQLRRFQGPAPATAEQSRLINTLLAEQSAPSLCLQSSGFVKITLSRAVPEYEARRVACSGCRGVTHEQYSAPLTHRRPRRLFTSPGAAG